MESEKILVGTALSRSKILIRGSTL